MTAPVSSTLLLAALMVAMVLIVVSVVHALRVDAAGVESPELEDLDSLEGVLESHQKRRDEIARADTALRLRITSLSRVSSRQESPERTVADEYAARELLASRARSEETLPFGFREL
ncbi:MULTISPECIES: hypothetical protein [unclassified Nocardiopsis]|uniref:hypothetical protein n=1 Tax=unclassified Nocardiopsis TaxID=2649073 RepID=UPI0033E88545